MVQIDSRGRPTHGSSGQDGFGEDRHHRSVRHIFNSAAGSPVSMKGNIVAPPPSVLLIWFSNECDRPCEWPNSCVAVVFRSTERVIVSNAASPTVKRKPLVVLVLNWTSLSRMVPAL